MLNANKNYTFVRIVKSCKNHVVKGDLKDLLLRNT